MTRSQAESVFAALVEYLDARREEDLSPCGLGANRLELEADTQRKGLELIEALTG